MPGMVRPTAGMYYYGPQPNRPIYTGGHTPHMNQANYTTRSQEFIDRLSDDIRTYRMNRKRQKQQGGSVASSS
ncbi:hypothetical protein AWB83_06329 [Caballeronia ptereochthonis]|uniref:Uncharacterized protein n=1 Tax=Caballeronia ptereochthonis TaxID=1777144 RepID=A0A158E2I9_9BURK|nr:hypothetical protein AWB83_06329 [Caballeronia ptereochthonis]